LSNSEIFFKRLKKGLNKNQKIISIIFRYDTEKSLPSAAKKLSPVTNLFANLIQTQSESGEKVCFRD
jgi:hypothetical protein